MHRFHPAPRLPRFALPLIAVVALAVVAPVARGDEPTSAERERGAFFLKDGQRVLVLGDSITQAGDYVAYLEAFLYTRFPDRRFELIKLGLASETVSGLSEPDHPFPRPDVHDRLERALRLTDPDVVTACYGMNDGIYHPPGPERTEAYREGIRRLIEKVREAGARLVLLTPPPFDPVAGAEHLAPEEPEQPYGFSNIYPKYDTVLERYSRWLRTLGEEDGVELVVDLHGPIMRYMQRRRQSQPGFTLSGDGIHPGPLGHWLMARRVLKAWGAPVGVDRAHVDLTADGPAVRRGNVESVRRTEGGGVALAWETRVPMPVDPRRGREAEELWRLVEPLNRHRLRVTGLPAGRYKLKEGGTTLGMFGAEAFEEGIELSGLEGLSTNRRAGEVWRLVRERREALGLAWLEHVGHERPGGFDAPPLEEAWEEAAAIEEEIRELAEPRRIELRITPVE